VAEERWNLDLVVSDAEALIEEYLSCRPALSEGSVRPLTRTIPAIGVGVVTGAARSSAT